MRNKKPSATLLSSTFLAHKRPLPNSRALRHADTLPNPSIVYLFLIIPILPLRINRTKKIFVTICRTGTFKVSVVRSTQVLQKTPNSPIQGVPGQGQMRSNKLRAREVPSLTPPLPPFPFFTVSKNYFP